MKNPTQTALIRLLCFLLISCVLILTGCESKEPAVSKNEISQAFIVNSSPTFQGYHYRGSDDQYHYFSSQWKYGADRKFKIKIDDLDVQKTFSVDEPKLRIFLYEMPDKELEVFAEFDGRKIYMEK